MTEQRQIKQVTVYCASSSMINKKYMEAARSLGMLIAEKNISILYGGGAAGLMGAVADGALSQNGDVYGIIPQFMVDLEWGHKGLTKLITVQTMHERKEKLIENSDAVIALPGGSGTLEEVLEIISLKRLGLYLNPIVIVNTDGYYNPLKAQLEQCIREKFMDERHYSLWTFVDHPRQVLDAIQKAPAWAADARSFAVMR